jgi:hypothetical protein
MENNVISMKMVEMFYKVIPKMMWERIKRWKKVKLKEVCKIVEVKS